MLDYESSHIIKFNKLNMVYKILKFLSGKKSAIASIIGLVIAFCASKGYLDTEVVILLGSISTIVFGTASMATKTIVYPEE